MFSKRFYLLQLILMQKLCKNAVCQSLCKKQNRKRSQFSIEFLYDCMAQVPQTILFKRALPTALHVTSVLVSILVHFCLLNSFTWGTWTSAFPFQYRNFVDTSRNGLNPRLFIAMLYHFTLNTRNCITPRVSWDCHARSCGICDYDLSEPLCII